MFPHFYKDILCLFLFFAIVFLTISCGKEERISAAQYYVCKEWELPDELNDLINRRKEEKFNIIYEDAGYQYIAAGYGKQHVDHYVAAVKKIEETEDKLYVDFILIHASRGEEGKAGEPSACPYIVLRIEKNGKTVLFQD